MVERWPSWMPQGALREGNRQSTGDNTVASEADIGAGKARQVSSNDPEPYAIDLRLTTDQVERFKHWMKVTLRGRTSDFWRPCPWTHGIIIVDAETLRPLRDIETGKPLRASNWILSRFTPGSPPPVFQKRTAIHHYTTLNLEKLW